MIAAFMIQFLRFECLYIQSKNLDFAGYGLKSVWKITNLKTKTIYCFFINNGLDDIAYFLFYIFNGIYSVDKILSEIDVVIYNKSVSSFNSIQKKELKKLLIFYHIKELHFEATIRPLKISQENTYEIEENLECVRECENAKFVILHLKEKGEAEEKCTIDEKIYILKKVDVFFTNFKKSIFNYDFSKKHYFSKIGNASLFSTTLPNAPKRKAFYEKL